MLKFPGHYPEFDDPALWKELEQVSSITGPDGRSKCIAQIRACELIIAELEAETDTADTVELPRILAKLAIFRLELAQFWLLMNDGEAVDRVGQTAVENAMASGYHNIIYRCLSNIGYMTSRVDHLLMAFPYAHASVNGWANGHLHVLKGLGYQWSQNVETLPLARLTTRWARLFVPHDIGPWFSEYIWLARHSLRSEIDETITKGGGDTYESIAAYAAALHAAGLIPEAIVARDEGQAKAEGAGASDWAKSFKHYRDLFERGKILYS